MANSMFGPTLCLAFSLCLWTAPASLTFGQPASVPSTGQAAPTFSYFQDEGSTARDVSEDESNPNHPLTRGRTSEDNEKIARDAARKHKAGESPQQAAEEALPAPPNAPVVKSVEIVGATGDDLKKARHAVQSSVGEPLDPAKQREDIRRLYEQGAFRPNIAVQAQNVPGGVNLQYVVEPNPRVGSITFAGNNKMDSRRLTGQLPVKQGEVYTIQAQNKIRDSVTRFYDENGFSDAAVKVDERIAANNTVDLAITVDEGTKMQIKDLVIRGNDNYSDLKLKMKVNNKGSWGPFKHYFNETKFQQDMELIKALYVARGYLDAEVTRGEFTYAPDQSWVSPVIDVREGQRYKVGRLETRGYSVFGRDEVLSPFRGLQGRFYDAKEFSGASTKVRNMYGDEGFLQCEVDPDFHKDPSRGMVDVDVQVSEGPRIYVGNVKILAQAYPDDTEMGWLRRFYSRFSPPVRDEVVQREVRLKPGQVYRRFDEVRTRERLKSLNVFENVKVHDQMSADPTVRDCVVEVSQGNTGNLIFGVGFGDVEGGFVYANYVERNLFGMARDLRVSALLGSKSTNFEVSYLDRYFLGKDLAAKFAAYHTRYLRPGGLEQTITGGTAEFTRPLSEYLKDSMRLRLESLSYKFDDEKPEEDINDYVAATVRYKMMHDTRDDTFFPTEGRILAGSVETGAADGFLLKFEGQYARYTPVGDSWVWASNNVIGLLPYNSDNIGYGDRFFLGGSQDMRGFKLAGAGPHDSKNEDIALGGATKLLLQNEMRHPFTDNITGVLFADVGTLSEKALDFGQPRASVGAGVRLRLPIAQVALDLAVPVVKKDRDQTQIFHFTLTSAF